MRDVRTRPGFLTPPVGRLHAPLYKEVLCLIQEGALSVANADDAVSFGPGLCWGVMGPSLQWHLGGGAGAAQHYMETLLDRENMAEEHQPLEPNLQTGQTAFGEFTRLGSQIEMSKTPE